MDQSTHGRVVGQVRRVRQQLMRQPDLCLGKLLGPKQVQAAVRRHRVRFRQRLWTPLVTLWTFLYQVLCPDQSCRAAVARVLATVSVGGSELPSAKTDPYCKARQRLAEKLLADLARRNGRQLDAAVPASGLLNGRPIKIVDGTTVSAPDTPANQQAYPQPDSQKPGLGFPMLRLVGLISLSCGAVLDVAVGRYAGKRTGETSLLRQLSGGLRAGEVLLADGIFCNYWAFAMLLAGGVDVLSGHDGKRKVDFRCGRRLGPRDHVISWQKPACPPWMSQACYEQMPATLSVRQVQVTVAQRGFRTRQLLVVTTLTDAEGYPAAELAAAYRARWNAELDLRSIKVAMRMDVLRCKSPPMLRKEIWMHLLAYNLVRKLMAEAAAEAGCPPREISFTGALQTLVAFAPIARGGQLSATLYRRILQAVATHRVGDRPDRVQPRAIKRRPKKPRLLTEPRALAIARLLRAS